MAAKATTLRAPDDCQRWPAGGTLMMPFGNSNVDALLALIRCPDCLGELRRAPPSADNVDRLQCAGCGSVWPVRFGIPDLRGGRAVDPYLTNDEDLRAAERLHDRARTGTFAEVLASYYETNEKVPAAQVRRFVAGTMAAEERARAVMMTWQAWCGADGDRGTVLDVGCGTGPMLVAAQSPNVKLVGIDIGLRWLVLAAARLRDRHATAFLACAGAERLPLADQSVDVWASESLLENTASAAQAMAEAARAISPRGSVRVSTANRWSVGPDPHIGVPLGGWLPKPVVDAWAIRRHMVPPRRHLLGAGELRRLLSAPLFDQLRIGPPPVTDAQRQGASAVIRAAVDAYRVMARTAVGRAALVTVGPSLLAVARRTDVRRA